MKVTERVRTFTQSWGALALLLLNLVGGATAGVQILKWFVQLESEVIALRTGYLEMRSTQQTSDRSNTDSRERLIRVETKLDGIEAAIQRIDKTLNGRRKERDS